MEPPRPCSYLPDRLASHEISIGLPLTPEKYADLLQRGYRRFGAQIYRPACTGCRECVSIRIPAADYHFSASDRRVLKQNTSIRCVLAPAMASAAHLRLFNRYQFFMHRERGWALQQHDLLSYADAFLDDVREIGWEWRYYAADNLVGVSLMDKALAAISLVYFYYDPEWRPKSPGRFSILNQILFAKENGISHVYLGYSVAACRSLNYKIRFWPHETLDSYVSAKQKPVWRKAPKPESARMLLEMG